MAEKSQVKQSGHSHSKKRRAIGRLGRLRRANQKGLSGSESGKKRKLHIFPKFLRNAWAEIQQVTWPGRKETARLTVAVLIFSIIFGGFIAALDYGLDKLFKEVILR